MLQLHELELVQAAAKVHRDPVGFLAHLEKQIDETLVRNGCYDSAKHYTKPRIAVDLAQLLASRYEAAGWVVSMVRYQFQQEGRSGYDDPDGTMRGYQPELDFPAGHLTIQPPRPTCPNPSPGRCHGTQSWCDYCGDVTAMCDDPGCEWHHPPCAHCGGPVQSEERLEFNDKNYCSQTCARQDGADLAQQEAR